MRGTRILALALIVGLIVLIVAAMITLDPIGEPSSSPATTASGSPSPRPTEAIGRGLLEIEVGGGPRFALDTSNPPTGAENQSKLWFHDGAWWGLLASEAGEEFRIHRFDWAGSRWIDTGVRVSTRGSLHPDVVAEGDQLWVAGQLTSRRTAALQRYTYDPESVRYVPDADFPVTISEQRARLLTLARDDAGRLWAAWISEDRLLVSRTEGNDWTWGEPQAPPVPGVDVAADAATIVSYGETVALIWSGQNLDEVSVAIPAAADDAAWQHSTVAVQGLRHGDDHLNVSVLETSAGPRMFAAIETSTDAAPNPSPGDPQVVLLVIEPDGSSQQYLVGRVTDNHTRPIVLIDGENEIVYILATAPAGGGTIYYKASAIDDISFAEGDGAPLIEVEGLAALNVVTSTKQILSSSTGLVVLASDADAGSYAWAAARLPGDGSPDLGAAPEPVAVDDPLLFDTFDPFPPGAQLDPMWETRSSGSAMFAIAETDDGRRVAAAAGAPDGSHVRMCREILPVVAGRLRIEAEVMVTRVGLSDVTVMAARHEGVQSAVVRLDDRGVFSFFDGAAQIRTEVPYATGVWYRSVVEVDLDAHLYDWTVQRASDGATAFTVRGARWRGQAAGPVTDICLESADATGPQTVFAVDRVRVER